LDWFPKKCYWPGLDEAPSGTQDDHGVVLRDINGDSPISQKFRRRKFYNMHFIYV
jgi:hypothetical protein